MCVNVIRRQPSPVSVQRRFRPCRRHLCRRPSSVRRLQPLEPALRHQQHLPDHSYRPVHPLKPLRRIGAQPQGRKGRLHNIRRPDVLPVLSREVIERHHSIPVTLQTLSGPVVGALTTPAAKQRPQTAPTPHDSRRMGCPATSAWPVRAASSEACPERL